MKKIINVICGIFLICCATACEDIMDTESGRIAYDDQHELNNPNDSIYSVIGVLAQLQQVADRILIMGELRGDLMTVDNEYASTDLQEINDISFAADNSYAIARDFYSIINNCNYIIARMDTSITEGQNKVMMPEYAQVKTLRAYTYWQMALIFGRVNYFTMPLTSIGSMVPADANIGIDELSQKLIADISPIADARPLDYGTIDNWTSTELFYPTKMLLGDLYLYNNMYDKAAEAYYSLIASRNIVVSRTYANTWESATRQNLQTGNMQAYKNDVVTRQIFNSDLRATHSQMRKLTYSDKPSLLPAAQFTEWMMSRTHFHTDNGQAISRYFNGDLRGAAEMASGALTADAFGHADLAQLPAANPQEMVITKFYNNLSGTVTDALEQRPLLSLAMVRPSTIYLRYAEAINRAGYPTTAFAVLKYGLNKNMYDTIQHRVDSNEVKRYPAYINFQAAQYDQNIGTAARGLGLGIVWDREQYVIPADADTTDFVEKAILNEMAAETCFEGNRFFDLLRISHHRHDHPALMAEKVAAKHADSEAMKQRLMNISAWFAR